MHELKVSVKKVMGTCTANPPVKPGDYFVINDGDISLPEGGFICAWALQSLIPVLTPKERDSAEAEDADWMWRVHHAQCPDPEGRVIYQIERTRVGGPRRGEGAPGEGRGGGARSLLPPTVSIREETSEGGLVNLKIHVESVTGKCTSRMKPGTTFTLRSGRLYIPQGEHACLYALHAALPLLWRQTEDSGGRGLDEGGQPGSLPRSRRKCDSQNRADGVTRPA